MFLGVTLSFTSSKHVPFFSLSSVTISTSVSFDGLLVTGLYTSTPVQSAPIPAPAAFGFGESCFFCQYKLFILLCFLVLANPQIPREVSAGTTEYYDPAQWSTSIPRLSIRPLPFSGYDRSWWMRSQDDVIKGSARWVFIDVWENKKKTEYEIDMKSKAANVELSKRLNLK